MTTITTQPSTAPIFRDWRGNLIDRFELEQALDEYASDIRIGMTPPDVSFREYVELELKWQFCGTEADQ